ncbi:MAG: HAD-IA family hydrolase [Blastocatellia bacterium]
MLIPTPEVVFFDATGTLFEVRGGVGEIYGRVARDFGFESEPRTLQRNFARSFREQPALAFPSGTPDAELAGLEKDWWRNLVEAVFADLGPFPRFDEFFDEIFERFRGREFWRVYDDVEPALAGLKQQGFRLGVISNFDSRLYDALRACDLDRFFDSVHISTRVGAAKPDPAIFQAALGHYRIDPSQACHVGDSLREDVAGARAAGLHAFLIDRPGEQNSEAGYASLSSLFELLEML